MNDYKYKTGAYLRLSKGDGDVDGTSKSESNSISSQRLIIDRFIEDNPEFELVETYIDDGYTGTNFDRPAMQQMLADIDDGKIDCVLVKDLSRFGRERIETGTYILRTFKEKNVRFIAINDNYDSLTAGSSEKHLVMPIKNLTNDFYSMDISSKVRASQSVKREKGEFIGAYAPYGYEKDPNDKNHLVVDPEAAKVVKDIFASRISGMSANAIATYLKEMGVLTPAHHKHKSHPEYKPKASKSNKCNWNAKQVIRILTNEVYLGSVVQGRKYRVSYKVRKVIYKPKEEWCIVPFMHEPIISELDFNLVQSHMQRDVIKAPDKPEGYLFSGLLFCGDCGSTMYRKLRRNKNSSHVEYLCKSYNSKQGCSSHKIFEDDLIKVVLESLNGMIFRLCKYNELVENLQNINVSLEAAIYQNQEIKNLEQEKEHYEMLRQSLYQDTQEGLLSKELFEKFRTQYSSQIEQIERAIGERTKMIENLYSKGLSVSKFLQKFKNRPTIEKLDRVILVTLIDKILVYEDGTLEIVYRYSDQIKVLNDIAESQLRCEKGGQING